MKNDGISLIEVIVVCAIIMTVLGIAGLETKSMASNSSLRTAADDYKWEVQQRRAQAAQENRLYRITVNVTPSNTVVVEQCSNIGTPCAGWATVLTKTLTSSDRTIFIANALYGAGTVTTIQPRGTVTSGSITLQNGRGSTAVISTNLLGRTVATYTFN
ncbi:MAG TPA: hypothetical protein VK445_03540 [Dissulfurispiraceae bacterium]|nr:hypothetical protein [Dissulfurispiraceae bacterium]